MICNFNTKDVLVEGPSEMDIQKLAIKKCFPNLSKDEQYKYNREENVLAEKN